MPMKRILFPVFLMLIFSLTGCGLLGWDKPKPFSPPPITTKIDEWTKKNMDEEQRKKDWHMCAVDFSGYVNCLMYHGYHYTGKCKGVINKTYACHKHGRLFQ